MPRRYELSVRAERVVENRNRLVSAAHALFLRQGWTMTTMTQVAAAAGLARPTVYLHFDTKVDLLIACIDTSLSETPVRDRVDYQAMGVGTAPQRAATAARWLRDAYERSAAIQRVLDDAAVSTPEAVQAQTRLEQRRHDEFANACRLVLEGRTPSNALVDEVWALGSRAMWFKLAERGWSPDDWEPWFARVVLDATHAHGAKR
ncbi:MAG TPA: helix-turn-helix domain-containing protein [Streptosporangiaceae bacterium]|nr:helix-turn-helix domain-containing protein [Streptosporangiaceae bacterium]